METAEMKTTGKLSEKIESSSQKELMTIISEYGISYSSDEDLYRVILKDNYHYDPAIYEHPFNQTHKDSA
ncbi:MAG: hypothetical protein IAE90_06745 [Ignavibacteria bacterium]|nr:hypothetical protein [Ignavibacteria bacterium]